MNNYCILNTEEIDNRISVTSKDWRLGGMVTAIKICDKIFSEGLNWGEDKIIFKLKTSLN